MGSVSVLTRTRLAPVAVGFLALAAPESLLAQRSARPLVNQGPEGFLFREPRVTFAVRGGFNFQNTESSIFGFFTRHLTLDRNDFNAVVLAAELGVAVGRRWEVVLGVGHAETRKESEFRDYVTEQGLPIAQTTLLATTPLTVAGRFYLWPRGRRVGRFVWIPARFSVYAGAGAGAAYYLLKQTGAFVDFSDLTIFGDRLQSDGWAPVALVMAGAEYSLSTRVLLNGDVRYQFAKGELGGDFVGFTDGINLSGTQFSAGLKVRF
ncbi:MAG: hypothetical protein KatS3mg081_2338 [Gemmatimonadales bacterium]|nr:hypothetical protein HRbin33_00907 [bacterium HR33]GIW52983.1 MAG: hypothetical protein KatS3mg081_2338 [Gemmatimonadales bacterium]